MADEAASLLAKLESEARKDPSTKKRWIALREDAPQTSESYGWAPMRERHSTVYELLRPARTAAIRGEVIQEENALEEAAAQAQQLEEDTFRHLLDTVQRRQERKTLRSGEYFGSIAGVHFWSDRVVTEGAGFCPVDRDLSVEITTGGGVSLTPLQLQGRSSSLPLNPLATYGERHIDTRVTETKSHDHRTLHLTVVHPMLSGAVALDPDYETHARDVVAKVTAAIRASTLPQATKTEETAGTLELDEHVADPVQQLAKLSELHNAGALSDEEFNDAKTRLLKRL